MKIWFKGKAGLWAKHCAFGWWHHDRHWPRRQLSGPHHCCGGEQIHANQYGKNDLCYSRITWTGFSPEPSNVPSAHPISHSHLKIARKWDNRAAQYHLIKCSLLLSIPQPRAFRGEDFCALQQNRGPGLALPGSPVSISPWILASHYSFTERKLLCLSHIVHNAKVPPLLQQEPFGCAPIAALPSLPKHYLP